MADPRVDRPEQQFSSLKTIIEGLAKNSDEQSKKMDENTAKVNNLLYKENSGSCENSAKNKHEKNSSDSFNNMGSNVAKLDFPKYNEMDYPTS
jgi:hypothetical protein